MKVFAMRLKGLASDGSRSGGSEEGTAHLFWGMSGERARLEV